MENKNSTDILKKERQYYAKSKKNNATSLATEEIIAMSHEFDQYDITDHLTESRSMDFEVDLARRNFRLEKSLAEKIFKIFQKRGISPVTYINQPGTTRKNL